jgi:hypothetical protein
MFTEAVARNGFISFQHTTAIPCFSLLEGCYGNHASFQYRPIPHYGKHAADLESCRRNPPRVTASPILPAMAATHPRLCHILAHLWRKSCQFQTVYAMPFVVAAITPIRRRDPIHRGNHAKKPRKSALLRPFFAAALITILNLLLYSPPRLRGGARGGVKMSFPTRKPDDDKLTSAPVAKGDKPCRRLASHRQRTGEKVCLLLVSGNWQPHTLLPSRRLGSARRGFRRRDQMVSRFQARQQAAVALGHLVVAHRHVDRLM